MGGKFRLDLEDGCYVSPILPSPAPLRFRRLVDGEVGGEVFSDAVVKSTTIVYFHSG